MFRKIKILLYSLITIVVIAFFAGFMREYDNNSIPNNSTIVKIYASKTININKTGKDTKKWNKKNNKKTFFVFLKKFARDEKISLVKMRINNFNGHRDKIVYDFGGNNNDFSLYQNESIKKLTDKELMLEDMYGLYSTNAKGKSLKHLVSWLKKNQFLIQVEDTSLTPKTLLKIFLTNLTQFDLVVGIGIIGVLFIVMVLEKVYRFKAYAVMKINGLTNWQIFKHDLKNESVLLGLSLGLIILITTIWNFKTFTVSGWQFFLPYIFALLLLLFVSFFLLNSISYAVLALMNPYLAIKGEENSRSFLIIGYALKIIILALMMVNAVTLFNHYEIYDRDQNIVKKWHRQKNSYLLGLGWNVNDHQEDKQVAKMAHQLVVQASDVIVAQNSQQFQPGIRTTSPEDGGNVIIANSNFIKNSEIRPKYFKIDKHKVILLVPKNRLDQVKQAKKQLISFISFQNTLPNYYPKKFHSQVQVVPIASNQKIFNYTVVYDILSSISTDPLIAVTNDKQLSDDFYLASISQGTIQFFHLKQLKKLVKRLGLSPYVVSITSRQTLLWEYNIKANRQILMLTITTILTLLQLIFIILFVSSTFLQNNRRKIAVYQVFGKSNAKLLGSFLTGNLILDVLVIAVTLAGLHRLNILPFGLGYLLLEAIIIWLTYYQAQRNLLTSLNHGN